MVKKHCAREWSNICKTHSAGRNQIIIDKFYSPREMKSTGKFFYAGDRRIALIRSTGVGWE